MVELLHRHGFLGTSANWAADVTLLLSLLVGITLTVGVLYAIKGNYTVHRWLQTAAATLNLILVLWLMVLPFRDFVASPSNSGGLPGSALLTTKIHAAVGFFRVDFGCVRCFACQWPNAEILAVQQL